MARKLTPTRTTGPLHFEDLENRRFEDLVRQLIYDFRIWDRLEATGRAGSDEGFDARALEVVSDATTLRDDDTDEDQEPIPKHRVWLVQCKREKSITPKKLRDYIDALPHDDDGEPLHGLIFAAACDFSKKARDDFRAKVRERGITEAHLWGKAEIEDMLYQPKNDNLLFAYFGISLQVRKRSLRTELRSQLATKRKAKKVIDQAHRPILIRDANDTRYPYLDDDQTKDRFDRGRWFPVQVRHRGCKHDGVHLLRSRYLAYIANDNVSWDIAEAMNDAKLDRYQNPWLSKKAKAELEELEKQRHIAMEIWDKLDEKNRAWFESYGVLPYDKILAIDEDGDEIFDGPHFYVEPFEGWEPPFADYCPYQLETIGYVTQHCRADDEHRVNIFPRAK